MEQNNMDSRNEQWRIDLRNSKTPKERTAIPRVEMPQLDPKYRITCNEEVNQGITAEQADRLPREHQYPQVHQEHRAW